MPWSAQMLLRLQQEMLIDQSVARARDILNKEFHIYVSWSSVNSMARRKGWKPSRPVEITNGR